jgi:hypothetical protein
MEGKQYIGQGFVIRNGRYNVHRAEYGIYTYLTNYCFKALTTDHLTFQGMYNDRPLDL